MSVNLDNRIPSVEPEDCLLIMTINIGDGRSDTIYLSEKDNVSCVSESFCEKHQLPSKVQVPLAAEIERQLSLVEELVPVVIEPPKVIKRTVHERLFSRSKRRPVQSAKSVPKKKISVESSQRLYVQGVKKREILQKKWDKVRSSRKESEVKDVTFKPLINKKTAKSRYLMMNRWQEHLGKLERARKENAQAEISKCTFSPSIDQRSNKIASKNNSEERFKSLYENAKEMRNHVNEKSLQILRESCTFSPDIKRTRSANKALLSRKKKRTQTLRFEEEENYSEYFKPKIGKPPKRREFSPSKVGDYLYSLSYKKPEPTQNSESLVLTNEHSETLLKQLKLKKYREIFSALGPQEGRVSRENAQTCQLVEPLQVLIQPLIEEIDGPVDFSEFSQIMDVYHKLLSPVERSMLLYTGKPKISLSKHTFRPKINKSMEINKTSLYEKEDHKTNFYQREISRKNDLNAKIERERIIKAANELQPCTFKPRLK